MLNQRTSEDVTGLGERLAALVGEARLAARQHVDELDEALARVAALAGDVPPPERHGADPAAGSARLPARRGLSAGPP